MKGQGHEMAMDMEQVISKVEKLLALGTSSNEHEAASAVRKAQDLLLAYGLTMEQVAGRKANTSDVKETTAFDVYEEGKPTAWRMDVLRAVAATSGVWVATGYRSDRIKSKHARYGERWTNLRTAFFIGLPGDVEMAGYAYSFLVGEIERLAGEYAGVMWAEIKAMAKANDQTVHEAEALYVWNRGTHPLKAKSSWTKGAAAGVAEMLYEMERSRKSTSDPATTALVLNREQVIRDYWYMKRYGKTYEQYTADLKAKTAASTTAVEKVSPSEAKRRAERDERAWRRAYERQQNEEARKWAAMDRTAYRSGHAAGRSMNIRQGVGGSSPSRPEIEG